LNQPKLSSCANWSSKAITLTNGSRIGQYPSGIAINRQNNIYVINRNNSNILVWYNESMDPIQIIQTNSIKPWSLFVTISNDIYIDNGYSNGRIDKWTLNTTNIEIVMNINSSCTGLFVDIYDRLYCSLANKHYVIKFELENNKSIPMIIAGTGCPGPVANMLDHPYGIFVDNKTNLYVADSHNDRIQLFLPNRLDAITVVGFGVAMTLILNRPTGIVLDADDNLYIVDSHHHRIIRMIENKFQCLIGCSGDSGSSANHLDKPQTMAFDTVGNIFVTDYNNHRIQKFNLINSTCQGMFIFQMRICQ